MKTIIESLESRGYDTVPIRTKYFNMKNDGHGKKIPITFSTSKYKKATIDQMAKCIYDIVQEIEIDDNAKLELNEIISNDNKGKDYFEL